MSDSLHLDRRALLAGLAALAMPRIAAAATAGDYHAVQALMDDYVSTRKLPGLAAAIQRNGDAVRFLNAGTVAFDAPAKVTPDTLWRIYSMTKPITGMAAMKLIEDGKLKLDQPVSDILPDFKDMKIMGADGATRPAAKPITIRTMLTHTSGLSYGPPVSNAPSAKLYTKAGIVPGSRAVDKDPAADFPPARDLETFGKRLATLPLDFEPGARWQYSVALDLMGLVIQRVSGKSFYDYLRINFFEPLGMKDTDFMVPKAKLDRFTSVYAVQNGQRVVAEDRKGSPFARDRDLPSGGGGLVSSSRDYIKFLTMLVNEGEFGGRRIVKPETVRLARSNLITPPTTFFGNGFGAAMAVQLKDTPGGLPKDAFWWFGIAGTQMWIDPVSKFTMCLMLQENPTSDPIQAQVRTAAYKDLAAIKA